ncbi:MAG: helix-hairpin-helix domain-containing protein, partial [Candidatus Thorarchaeota archaeon]
MRNREVARALKEIALLLEVEGKDKFKPRAYRRAMRAISSLGEDIEAIAGRDELTEIPGVGKAIAAKISGFLETGRIDLLDRLRKSVPVKVMELEAVPGVGPKTIKLVFDQLGVTDLDMLEKAAQEGTISALKGMGKKTEEQIIEGIKLVRVGLVRKLLSEAMSVSGPIERYISEISGVRQIVTTGSLRRRRETVGDLDMLVDADDAVPVMDAFTAYEKVANVTAKGETKSSVRLEGGFQVDLRVIQSDSFGAGLQYFTGSVDHNVRIRAIAQKKGLKLNEYGLFKDEEKVAG